MNKPEKQMRNTFIISLIFALLVTIFTIQNASIITINFFMWQFNISLAVIILVCLILGALITILLSLRKEMNLKKENKKLLNEVNVLKTKIQENQKNNEKISDTTESNNEDKN